MMPTFRHYLFAIILSICAGVSVALWSPSLASAQTYDANGNLNVNLAAGSGTPSFNLTQLVGVALQSGGISNAASTLGMLDAIAACRYDASLPTLTTGRYNSEQCDVNGRRLVVSSGNVASGATDSGNPVKVGGVYNSTFPTFTTGQRGDAQLDDRGALRVAIAQSGSQVQTVGSPQADGVTNSVISLLTSGYGYGFNGTTWDRLRSGAFTASTTPTGVLDSLGLAVFNSTPPTFTNGQYGHLQMDNRGALYVEQFTNGTTMGDGYSNNGLSPAVPGVGEITYPVFLRGFNGTTWDRLRLGAFTASTTPTGVLSSLPLAVYNSSLPTFTNGQYGHVQMGNKGSLHVELFGPNSTNSAGIFDTSGDDVSTGTNVLFSAGLGYGYDGTTWDRLRTSTIGTGQLIAAPPDYSYSAVATGDVQIKGSAGFLHACTFTQNDAAPTAGTIIIYDSLTETGTQIYNWNVQTTAFDPMTVILDYKMATGIYLGFTTTNDVNVSCSYR